MSEETIKKCTHPNFEAMCQADDEHDSTELKCDLCGKTGSDMFDDLDDINPNRKVSQQPHGSSTLYCNICQRYVTPTSFGGENDICPYHQRSYQSEEGTVMMYDEFDQNGEAW